MVEKAKKRSAKPKQKQKQGQKQSQKQVVNLVVNNNTDVKKKKKKPKKNNSPVVRISGVPSQDMVYRQNQINTEYNPPNILQTIPLTGNQLVSEMRQIYGVHQNPMPQPPYQTTLAIQQDVINQANGINNQLQMENAIQKKEEANQKFQNVKEKKSALKMAREARDLEREYRTMNNVLREIAGDAPKKKPTIPSQRRVTGLTKFGKIDKRTIQGKLKLKKKDPEP